MVSTAARASPTAATPSFNLFQVAASPVPGMPPRKDLRRAALLASASNALDSPRNAFCASKGIRCTTSDNCSAGAATGAELRVSAVRTAAMIKHSTTNPANTGSKLRFGDFSIRLVVILLFHNLTCRLQEALAFHQALQAQDRPDFAPAAKGAGKIAIAADHRRRCFRTEFRFRKTPKPQNLIDHQTRRD